MGWVIEVKRTKFVRKAGSRRNRERGASEVQETYKSHICLDEVERMLQEIDRAFQTQSLL